MSINLFSDMTACPTLQGDLTILVYLKTVGVTLHVYQPI